MASCNSCRDGCNPDRDWRAVDPTRKPTASGYNHSLSDRALSDVSHIRTGIPAYRDETYRGMEIDYARHRIEKHQKLCI